MAAQTTDRADGPNPPSQPEAFRRNGSSPTGAKGDTTTAEDIEERHLDALGGMWDREQAQARREPEPRPSESEEESNEREDPSEEEQHDHETWDDVRAAKNAQKIREKLDDPKTARAVYLLDVVAENINGGLTPAEGWLLVTLAKYGTPDLDNIFPRQDGIAASLNVTRGSAARLIHNVEAKGWLKRHRYRKMNGQESSAGYQLRVPPRVLSPADSGWDGPAMFGRREHVEKRAPQAGAES